MLAPTREVDWCMEFADERLISPYGGSRFGVWNSGGMRIAMGLKALAMTEETWEWMEVEISVILC